MNPANAGRGSARAAAAAADDDYAELAKAFQVEEDLEV